MTFMNRMATASNRFQGKTKKVLCVCSAGLLRSPTTAVVLSQEPYNFNTRAAGLTDEYALIPVDAVLLHWADEIVVMEPWQAAEVKKRMDEAELDDTPIITLNIEDSYSYRDPELMRLIREAYNNLSI